MSFHVSDLKIEKLEGGKVKLKIVCNQEYLLTAEEWISIITEMSYKPENADQHKKAEEFHLGT